MAQEMSMVYFADNDEDYFAAEEHIDFLERGEHMLEESTELMASDAAKDRLQEAMLLTDHPCMVSAYRIVNGVHQFCIAHFDGENEQVQLATGGSLEDARTAALESTVEYLEKTPISYHSHFHGGIAEAKE